MKKEAAEGVNGMKRMLMAFSKSTKPVVMVARGLALGIGFTMLAHAHFLYVNSEARFHTPFMSSAQSPEGASTYLFP